MALAVKNFFPRKRNQGYTCSNPSKKLVIRNFGKFWFHWHYMLWHIFLIAHTEKLQEFDYRCQNWTKLETAILSILNPKSNNPDPNCSLEDLYQSVQNLCSRANRDIDGESYQKLKDLIFNYVQNTLIELFLDESDQRLLPLAEQCWNSYCIQMKMIRNIFLFLDRTFVLQRPDLSSIWCVFIFVFTYFYSLFYLTGTWAWICFVKSLYSTKKFGQRYYNLCLN